MFDMTTGDETDDDVNVLLPNIPGIEGVSLDWADIYTDPGAHGVPDSSSANGTGAEVADTVQGLSDAVVSDNSGTVGSLDSVANATAGTIVYVREQSSRAMGLTLRVGAGQQILAIGANPDRRRVLISCNSTDIFVSTDPAVVTSGNSPSAAAQLQSGIPYELNHTDDVWLTSIAGVFVSLWAEYY